MTHRRFASGGIDHEPGELTLENGALRYFHLMGSEFEKRVLGVVNDSPSSLCHQLAAISYLSACFSVERSAIQKNRATLPFG
jgi:hypothetical protein